MGICFSPNCTVEEINVRTNCILNFEVLYALTNCSDAWQRLNYLRRSFSFNSQCNKSSICGFRYLLSKKRLWILFYNYFNLPWTVDGPYSTSHFTVEVLDKKKRRKIFAWQINHSERKLKLRDILEDSYSRAFKLCFKIFRYSKLLRFSIQLSICILLNLIL